jgi:CobQ-like glutamine amidotransferase family enzyme
MKKIVIGYLYPDLMNTYGDGGNILALARRCGWRGIPVTVKKISLGQAIPNDINLIFFGGGQDREQVLVSKDLKKKAGFLKKFVENGGPLLSVCGGYQLLGNFYKDPEGNILPGIGLFNANTFAGPKRMIGNIILLPFISCLSANLVGFENHSGQTYLGIGMRPLGKVLRGFGNNGTDGYEGCVYKNAIGTYLHGSLLPKNPELADWLIEKALEYQTGKPVKIKPLEDNLEKATRDSLIRKFSR